LEFFPKNYFSNYGKSYYIEKNKIKNFGDFLVEIFVEKIAGNKSVIKQRNKGDIAQS
jgi:hypothetical protein